MTKAQQKDLFIEWGLYEPNEQRLMIDEYVFCVSGEDCNKERFLSFLKDKLQIEGYWKKVGLICPTLRP